MTLSHVRTLYLCSHTPRFRTHQYSRRAAMFQKYYEWTCEAAAREYAVKAHAEKAEVAAMAEYMVNAIWLSFLCEGGATSHSSLTPCALVYTPTSPPFMRPSFPLTLWACTGRRDHAVPISALLPEVRQSLPSPARTALVVALQQHQSQSPRALHHRAAPRLRPPPGGGAAARAPAEGGPRRAASPNRALEAFLQWKPTGAWNRLVQANRKTCTRQRLAVPLHLRLAVPLFQLMTLAASRLTNHRCRHPPARSTPSIQSDLR